MNNLLLAALMLLVGATDQATPQTANDRRAIISGRDAARAECLKVERRRAHPEWTIGERQMRLEACIGHLMDIDCLLKSPAELEKAGMTVYCIDVKFGRGTDPS